jgi:hypothetical protein
MLVQVLWKKVAVEVIGLSRRGNPTFQLGSGKARENVCLVATLDKNMPLC